MTMFKSYADALRKNPNPEEREATNPWGLCTTYLTPSLEEAMVIPMPDQLELENRDSAEFEWTVELLKSLRKRKMSPAKVARKERRRLQVLSRTNTSAVDMAALEERMEAAGWTRSHWGVADGLKERWILQYRQHQVMDFVWQMLKNEILFDI
ncbi:hypothetical protein BJ508DRAFT_312046 [Ascobolus immersus RN42]|uniref:Uncharacterized protein n=1 Tax=Ascobolus immersus RN42 TaxID=1160509 RepID=A0A3N4HQV2_ASCIM|nr:hypothetical protein BJ508DRAFT_312046 [Ascobolus immersus RN42]